MAKILIIEDSAFQRKIIKGILVENSHEVAEADNVDDGLELINEICPDCIITDLLMPGKDGFQLLETLKNDTISIPVIVLTANIQEGAKEKCRLLGVKTFLNKPPKPRELIESINDQMNH